MITKAPLSLYNKNLQLSIKRKMQKSCASSKTRTPSGRFPFLLAAMMEATGPVLDKLVPDRVGQ